MFESSDANSFIGNYHASQLRSRTKCFRWVHAFFHLISFYFDLAALLLYRATHAWSPGLESAVYFPRVATLDVVPQILRSERIFSGENGSCAVYRGFRQL